MKAYSLFFIIESISLIACIAPYSAHAIPSNAWIEEQLTIMQCKKNCSPESPEITPLCPSKDTTLMMYQLMKDVDKVFKKYGITYWIDGGTLLGAIRHKGIIPWDDDLDICINKKDISRVRILASVFDKLGYEMCYPLGGVIKIAPKGGIQGYYLGYPLKSPHIDILFTEQVGDKICFSRTIFSHLYFFFKGDYACFGSRNGEELYITQSELYPLQEYQFGEIRVIGARDPLPYLHALYGEDCMDVGYQWHNHTNGMQKIPAGKISLTEENRKAAQPTGPLLDTPL